MKKIYILSVEGCFLDVIIIIIIINLFKVGLHIHTIYYNTCIYNSYKIRANSSLLSKKVKLKCVKERNEIQNN